MHNNSDREYDVCLLLEGTYPYIPGGVSSWVHDLIRSLPHLQFTGVSIMPSSEEEWKPRYEIPPNFSGLRHIYLHDPLPITPNRLHRVSKKSMRHIEHFHQGLKEGGFKSFPEVVQLFRDGKMPLHSLIHGKRSWNFVVQNYDPEENDSSFIDYFWTYRISHLSMFKILNSNLPRARMYHTISTGYAGLLAAVANVSMQRPILLTEHGIYFKERKIEISQAEWIYDAAGNTMRVGANLGELKDLWISLFNSLSKITYAHAAQIITLYEGNRQMQIADGAPAEKTRVIPNGIDIDRFLPIAKQKALGASKDTYTIGFVGRVVPIKDVKTFLRACKIVSMRMPDIQVYIMGPTEEDKFYYNECRELVEHLDLQKVVRFTGKVNILDYFPDLDVIVLTSISEAQPLVLLEANCAGIPAVATDVGACRELLEGRTEEDKAIGPSGLISRSADPLNTGDCILRLLENDELRRQMALSGLKRVQTFYNDADLYKAYKELYASLGATGSDLEN